MLNRESGDKYDQTVIPFHHWLVFFTLLMQTLKAEDLEISHVRANFFFSEAALRTPHQTLSCSHFSQEG